MRSFRMVCAVAASLGGAACFGSVDVTKPPELDSSNFMMATVDGAEFRTEAIDVLREDGRISIIAIEAAQVENQAIIALYFPDGSTGTHALGSRTISGAVSGIYGQFAILPPTNIVWTTDATRVGSVTITTLTADRIAGTFQFSAVADSASASPQIRTVTTGSFAAEFE